MTYVSAHYNLSPSKPSRISAWRLALAFVLLFAAFGFLRGLRDPGVFSPDGKCWQLNETFVQLAPDSVTVSIPAPAFAMAPGQTADVEVMMVDAKGARRRVLLVGADFWERSEKSYHFQYVFKRFRPADDAFKFNQILGVRLRRTGFLMVEPWFGSFYHLVDLVQGTQDCGRVRIAKRDIGSFQSYTKKETWTYREYEYEVIDVNGERTDVIPRQLDNKWDTDDLSK